MPIDVRVVEQGSGVVWLGKEVVTGADLRTAAERTYASGQAVRRLEYILVDFTEISGFDVDNKDIAALSEQDREAAAQNPSLIIVAACSQDLAFGMSRMREIMLSDTKLSTRVCRTLSDARSWLEEQRKQRFQRK